MADRLARLGSEPRKLEVGKSFDKKNPSLYHGIRSVHLSVCRARVSETNVRAHFLELIIFLNERYI